MFFRGVEDLFAVGIDIASRDGYEQLLDLALAQVGKRVAKGGDRVLELKPNVLQEARQTIITNFKQVAETLNRDPDHVARFIFKESGKPGMIDGERLIISGKVTKEEIAKLLQMYFKEFVKCPVCGGVDTLIVSEKRFRFIVCEVCGAKNPVRKI